MEDRFKLLPVDYFIDHPMLQQKFRRLETLRKFLPYGLLNDPWAGETNQRFRLRDDQITQRGEARHDTRHRRIRQYRNKKLPGLVVLGERLGGLRHLHE